MKDKHYLEKIKAFSKIINSTDNIVFFGGAGVSTESNIPDFRSNDGLYNKMFSNYSPEEILSHSFFNNNPTLFYDYYFEKMIYSDALPNKAHLALTKLEEKGKLKAIITQNIDALHSHAGSKNVYELHGSVYRNYCTKCGKFFSLEELLKRKSHPYCECGGIIKPDVVLYEEPLNENLITEAINKILNAKVLIVAGTSLLVNPAASFISYFRGQYLIVINNEETFVDKYASIVFHENVGDVLDQVLKLID